jgi:hypothetical protein
MLLGEARERDVLDDAGGDSLVAPDSLAGFALEGQAWRIRKRFGRVRLVRSSRVPVATAKPMAAT